MIFKYFIKKKVTAIKSLGSLFLFLTVYTSVLSQNLISNSGFESGFNGFETDNYYPMTNPSVAGQFVVAKDPTAWNSAWSACKDRSGNGNMLIVDASVNTNHKFLIANNIPVQQGVTYNFSFWIQSISPTNNAFEKPKIKILIGDGNPINDVVFITDTSSFPSNLCEWKKISCTWKATGNLAFIQLSNTTSSSDGNDFAIDDLFFGLQPLKFTTNLRNNSSIIKNDAFLSFYPTGGIPPYQYSIDGGKNFSTEPTFMNLSPDKVFVTSVKDNNSTIVVGESIKTLQSLTANLDSIDGNSKDTLTAGSKTRLFAFGGDDFTWSSSPTDKTLKPKGGSKQTVAPIVNTQYKVATNTKLSANLLSNPDFENDKSSFNSDYFRLDTNVSNMQQSYGIVSNANVFQKVFADTIVPASGSKMMAVDGSSKAGQIVWSQIVPVENNAQYDFNFSATSLANISPANLEILINGIKIADFSISNKVGVWEKASFSWNAQAASTAKLEVLNTNLEKIGNDFAIDNFYFGKNGSVDQSVNQEVVLDVFVKPSVVVSNPVCQGGKGAIEFFAPKFNKAKYSVNGTIYDTSFIANLPEGDYSNLFVIDSFGNKVTLDTSVTIKFDAVNNKPIVATIQPGCDIRTATVAMIAPKGASIEYLMLNTCTSRPQQAKDTFALLNPCDGDYTFYAVDISQKNCRTLPVSIKVQDPPFRPRTLGVSTPTPSCTDSIASIRFSGFNTDYSVSVDSGVSFEAFNNNLYKGFIPALNDSIKPLNTYDVAVKYNPTGCVLRGKVTVQRVRELANIPLKLMFINPKCDTVGKFKVDTTLFWDGEKLNKDSIGKRLDSAIYVLGRINDSTRGYKNTFYYTYFDGADSFKVSTNTDSSRGHINIDSVVVRKDGIKLQYSNFYYRSSDGCKSNVVDTTVLLDDPYAVPRNFKVTATQPTCTVLTGSVAFDLPGFAYLRIDSASYKLDTINNKVDTVKLYPTAPNFEPILDPLFDTIPGRINEPYYFKAIPVDTAIARQCPIKDTAIFLLPTKPSKPFTTIQQSQCDVDSALVTFSPQLIYANHQSFAILNYGENGKIDTLAYKKLADSTFDPIVLDSVLAVHNSGKFGAILINDSANCASDSSQILIYKMKYRPKSPSYTFTTPNCLNQNKSILTVYPFVTNVSLDTLRYSMVLQGTTDTLLPKAGVDTMFEGLAPGLYDLIVKRVQSSADSTDPIGFEPGTALCDTIIPIDIRPASTSLPPVMQVVSADCIKNLATVSITSPIADTLRYLLLEISKDDTTGKAFDTVKTFVNIPVGKYHLYVRDTVTGCIADATQDITVQPVFPTISPISPEACDVKVGAISFTASGTEDLAYSLDKGENYSDFAFSFSFTDVPIGKYIVKGKNRLGCTTIDSLVVLNPSPSTPEKANVIFTSVPSCVNDSATVKFLNNFGDTLSWSINGNEFSKNDTIRLNAGNYTLTVKRDGSICANDTSIVITAVSVSKPFVSSSTGRFSFCKNDGGLTLQVNGSINIAKYEWYKDGVLLTNDPLSASLAINQAGNYAVTVTNIYGCSATSDIIVVSELPELTKTTITSPTASICAGNVTVTSNSSETITNYQWFEVNGGALLGENSSTLSTANIGSYFVQVTNANGCVGNSDTLSLVNIADKPKISGEDLLCRNNLRRSLLTCTDATTYKWYDVTDAGNILSTSKTFFATAGKYYVTAQIGTCPEVNSDTLQVYETPPAPIVTTDGSLNICDNQVITLTSSYEAFIQWQFNNADLTDSTKYILYPKNAGEYRVGVKIGECPVVYSTPVVLNASQAPLAIQGSTSFCEGLSTTLSSPAQVGINNWYKDDVLISNAASINAAAPATYKLVVVNGACSSTDSKVVSVLPLPNITFDITNKNALCTGTSAQLLASPINGEFTWKSLKSDLATVDAAGNVQAIKNGKASIEYTFKDVNGCINAKAFDINISDNVSIQGVVADTTYCLGNTPTLAFQTTGGIWSSSNDNIVAINPSTGAVSTKATGDVVITYALSNGPTCQDSKTIKLTINKSAAPTILENRICGSSELSTTLSGTANWSTGEKTPKISVTNDGTYSLFAVAADGCISETASIVVKVRKIPQLTTEITGGDTVCLYGKNNTLELKNATPDGKWSIDTLDARKAYIDSLTGLVTSKGTGSFTVYYKLTNADTCSSVEKTKVIKVDDFKLKLNAYKDTVLQGKQIGSLVASSNQPNNFIVTNWYPVYLFPSQTDTVTVYRNITVPISNSDTLIFSVAGKSTKSHCTDTANVVIYTRTFKGDPFVPNIFTPNGDRQNEFFKVYVNLAESIDFRVFNQWGEQVFITTDVNSDGWDGKFKGKPQPAGTYVYVLRCKLRDGNIVNKRGSFLLIR